jgi:hypothetical protein
MTIGVTIAIGQSRDRVTPLRPQTTQRQPTNANIVSCFAYSFRRNAAHTISAMGFKVDHGNLPWATGFPGSHDFHRARGHRGDVYIAVPRDIGMNENGKRPARNLSPDGTPSRPMEILD